MDASCPPAGSPTLGPLLFARGYDADLRRHRLTVLLAIPEKTAPPRVEAEGRTLEGRVADRLCGLAFHRFDMALPARGGTYRVGARAYPVRLADPADDTGIAFVSCNGKEEGDFDRPPAEREAMWERLLEHHRRAPLSLLLLGGDQIYADPALEAHPDLVRWAGLPPDRRGEIAATPEAERAVLAVFLDRWRRSVTAPAAARLMAEVPMAAMWDDHDIFDGYGSHPVPVQQSPLGRMVFAVARRIYRLFQAGGHGDPGAETLTFSLPQPGFAVVAPDLRSERRPDQVMGPAGWAATERALAEARPGAPLFLLSTVPALGPRLSLLEGLHRLVPGAQKYEDDLRDQWQSRAHRDEWRRFLALAAERAAAGAPVTFLSGEIHLAARGELRCPGGAVLHQLTSSGVSHPPPHPSVAAAFGALGALGGAPLPGHRIALCTVPGTGRRYVAERNVLLLARRSGRWHAAWEFETRGRTPWLAIAGEAAPAAPRAAAAAR